MLGGVASLWPALVGPRVQTSPGAGLKARLEDVATMPVFPDLQRHLAHSVPVFTPSEAELALQPPDLCGNFLAIFCLERQHNPAAVVGESNPGRVSVPR